jgi:hypothetical protein
MPDHSAYICVTCGTQFSLSAEPPRVCPICRDERQYVGSHGQRWTTLDALRRGQWRNVLREQEPNLFAIGTEPKFGIGQRALLVRTPDGNVLWDCISLLDDATVSEVTELGGVSAIAISHPHYYSSMVEWSRTFGDAPIILHAADRRWIMRPDPRIELWEGECKSIPGGLSLIRTGGHFEGYTVLHWPAGAESRGVLLSGDQPQVLPDPHWVSFMYSYPNFIPMNSRAIRRIVAALAPYRYDRIYGAFWPGVVAAGAEAVVQRSAERYLRRITDEPD